MIGGNFKNNLKLCYDQELVRGVFKMKIQMLLSIPLNPMYFLQLLNSIDCKQIPPFGTRQTRVRGFWYDKFF